MPSSRHDARVYNAHDRARIDVPIRPQGGMSFSKTRHVALRAGIAAAAICCASPALACMESPQRPLGAPSANCLLVPPPKPGTPEERIARTPPPELTPPGPTAPPARAAPVEASVDLNNCLAPSE